MLDIVSQKNRQIDRLCDIMRRLRDPDTGCPWDIKQDFDTIAPYTIEEAYEVADAIQQNDSDKLCDELGDLLLQVVFHAQIATDKNLFNFDDVARGISKKMIRRHPHIFADISASTEDEVRKNWEQIKAEERAAHHHDGLSPLSLMDDIPKNMPAAKVALKMQKRAASVGFDWPDTEPVFDKINEELEEFKDEIRKDGSQEALEDEFGDILFAIANLGRHLKIDPETALARTNKKFTDRFQKIEQMLDQKGKTPSESNLEEMDDLWNQVKKLEKAGSD